MKITNWCRKLSAALLSVRLLVCTAATAADLGVNLVGDGDFENVDLAVTGEDNGPRILGWNGRSVFAYSHDSSSSSAGIVPDFAQGANPPNAGHWYFAPANTGDAVDITGPNEFFQDIDVSTGATGAAIAAGRARYNLSADMSSLVNDDGRARVDLQFFDSGGGLVDIDAIIGPEEGPFDVWSSSLLAQKIQPDVTTIRVSLFGETQTGGPNGYIDNVVLRINVIPEPTTIALTSIALAAAGLSCIRRRG